MRVRIEKRGGEIRLTSVQIDREERGSNARLAF